QQRRLPQPHVDAQFLRGQVPIPPKGFSTLPAPKRQALPAGLKATHETIARQKRSEIARLVRVLKLCPRIWRRVPETPDPSEADPMPDPVSDFATSLR